MSPPGKPLDKANSHRDEVLRGWMAEYGPALRRYFQKKVGPAEAEDLVQDVFVSLQVRGSTETIDNVEGYLFRIAANALMRRHKRRGWDWAGHEARIALKEPRDGRKQYSGTIAGIEDNQVRLTGKDGQDYSVPFDSIHSAKLLLTDKLIKATAPLSTEGADLIKTEG